MIYLCTNPELLAQRTEDTEDTDQREARVVAAIDAGGDVIAEMSGCESYTPTWKHSGSFRDWSGGKHSQLHKVVAGLVAFTMESERETAERAAEAMTAELESGNHGGQEDSGQPCQSCGELVVETEACGREYPDGGWAYLCPDCYCAESKEAANQ